MAMTGVSIWRTVQHWMARPWVSVVLAAVLWIDALAMSPTSRAAEVVSGVGLIPIGRARVCYLPWRAHLVRDGAGLCLKESYRADALAELSCLPRTRKKGLWAPTVRVRDLRYFEWVASSASPAELNEGRVMFANSLQASGSLTREEAEDLRAGQLVRRRSLPAGYVHNAAALMTFGALLVSLAWIPLSCRRWRAMRRAARSRCPSCGYDLRGLNGLVCPECGTPWR